MAARSGGGVAVMENNNPRERETDAARQGEVVFAKPWKRTVFFAAVIATALVGAVALFAFT